ncbi:hypothetical protein BDV19DRAFT_386559 [Aspergillus venezuelensis]
MAHIQVPRVTLEDLHSFQAKHFPNALTINRYSQTQSPANLTQTTQTTQTTTNPPYEASTEEQNPEAEGEDLGYYHDGRKRTLTDEQIRIFRHSEVHALLRERQLAREEEEFQAKYGETNEDDGLGDEQKQEVEKKIEADEHSDCKQEELDAKTPAASGAGTGTKRSADGVGSNEPAAKRLSNSKSKSKMKSKLDTQEDVQLDYKEEESAPLSKPRGRAASQYAGRKIISYDD